jgi:hypothetical protein
MGREGGVLLAEVAFSAGRTTQVLLVGGAANQLLELGLTGVAFVFVDRH